MDNMISLEFKYRSRKYYALIRSKEDDQMRVHSVTIMNGDLERLLYGNHIILEKEGCFHSALPIASKQLGELKQSIINALCRHLQATRRYRANNSQL